MKKTSIASTFRRLAALLLLAGGFTATAAAQRAAPGRAPGNDAATQDPQVEAARVTYDAANWPRGARRPGFELARLVLPDLTGEQCEFDASATKVTRRFADAGGTPRVLVEMRVRERIAAAHAALLDDIAHVQSVKTLPTTASRGMAAGDIGFVGYAGVQQDHPAWIAFVVGNIQFRVVSLDPSTPAQPDLRGCAERLSAAAADVPPLEAGTLVPVPAIDKAAADRVACKAGDLVALDVVASDPSGRAATLAYEVAGSGQGYVETGAAGRPVLHTTAPGRIEVVVHAFGANGSFASKKIEIEVAKKQ